MLFEDEKFHTRINPDKKIQDFKIALIVRSNKQNKSYIKIE